MELNDKLIEKAKKVKSTDELISIAKENSIELTDEEAKTYFAILNEKIGELGDDELDSVAGGKKCGTMYDGGNPIIFPAINTCEYWKDKKTFEVIPEGGKCSSCIHCHFAKLGWLCMADERYNN